MLGLVAVADVVGVAGAVAAAAADVAAEGSGFGWVRCCCWRLNGQ